MRLGVIADVHANLPALDAVVERLEAEGVDAYVCAGDVVGYGPFPNECVERVAGLRGMACVAGNHDLIALGRLSSARCIPLAQETLTWTARALGADARSWLEALSLEASPAPGLLLAHGSPGDPEEYVRTSERARELLEATPLLVLGHTHEPWVFEGGPADHLLLNPGSVGQSRSRDPRARAAILDVEQRRATLVTVDYDADETRRALRAHGLPPGACHLPPARLPRRIAGRAARALGLR
jgi:putative phosphoesterase